MDCLIIFTNECFLSTPKSIELRTYTYNEIHAFSLDWVVIFALFSWICSKTNFFIWFVFWKCLILSVKLRKHSTSNTVCILMFRKIWRQTSVASFHVEQYFRLVRIIFGRKWTFRKKTKQNQGYTLTVKFTKYRLKILFIFYKEEKTFNIKYDSCYIN